MTLNRRPMRPLESLSSPVEESHMTPGCEWPPVPVISCDTNVLSLLYLTLSAQINAHEFARSHVNQSVHHNQSMDHILALKT